MSKTPHSETDASPINQPTPESMPERLFQSLGAADTGTTSLDYVGTRRAFTQSYVCETADGEAMIGAIRVTPASKGMADDISGEVRQLATALTAAAEGSGMLVDIPRAVETDQRVEKLRALEASLDHDDADWTEQLQADLVEESATVESVYGDTTTAYDHLIVLRVDKLDAATALTSEGGFSDLWGVGSLVGSKNKRDLVESDRLHRQMMNTLSTRLDRLARRVGQIDGVRASPISSVRLSELLARYYRVDDLSRVPSIRELIRQSPVPESHSDAYGQSLGFHSVSVDDQSINPVASTSVEDRCRAYQSVLAPQSPVSVESDGSFSIGDHEVASIMVTSIPPSPGDAFMEPVYRYDNPNVSVSIATHFDRQDDETAQMAANDARNSLEDRVESPVGGVFVDRLPEKHDTAEKFASNLANSDLGAFRTATFITLSATSTVDKDGTHVPASDVLDEAVDDIIETELKEKCGIGAQRLNDAHQAGWQSTAPAAQNEVGSNRTVRADGLAKQFPYQYRSLNEPDGIRVGLHEYLQTPSYLQVFGDKRGNGHNMGFYGSIGSGKSTNLQSVAYQLWEKYQRPDVDEDLKLILSTPMQDFQGISKALGGKRIVIGGGTPLNPQDIQYLPVEQLRQVGEEKRPWLDMLERLDEFLTLYYDIEGKQDYGEKKDVWEKAAKQAQRDAGINPEDPETFKNDPAPFQDTIDNVLDMRNNPEEYVSEKVADDDKSLETIAETARAIVTSDIEPFEEYGRFHHFTKPASLDLSEHDVLYLDFQNYEGDDQMGGLEMQMRLSDLYEQGKAHDGPVFMGVDEFADIVDNPKSKQFFDRVHRRSRHWQMSVALATQQFGDLLTETEDGEMTLKASSEVVINNQKIKYFHATDEMNATLARDLNLSERSHTFIDEAATGEKSQGYSQALLVVDGNEYPLRIEMSDKLNPRAFAIFQHDPDDHPPLREFLLKYGATADVCNWRWA